MACGAHPGRGRAHLASARRYGWCVGGKTVNADRQRLRGILLRTSMFERQMPMREDSGSKPFV